VCDVGERFAMEMPAYWAGMAETGIVTGLSCDLSGTDRVSGNAPDYPPGRARYRAAGMDFCPGRP